MSSSDEQNSHGRRENAAEPLGERPGLVDKASARKTAEHERRTAGPDGPDARAVGETFKR